MQSTTDFSLPVDRSIYQGVEKRILHTTCRLTVSSLPTTYGRSIEFFNSLLHRAIS